MRLKDTEMVQQAVDMFAKFQRRISDVRDKLHNKGNLEPNPKMIILRQASLVLAVFPHCANCACRRRTISEK